MTPHSPRYTDSEGRGHSIKMSISDSNFSLPENPTSRILTTNYENLNFRCLKLGFIALWAIGAHCKRQLFIKLFSNIFQYSFKPEKRFKRFKTYSVCKSFQNRTLRLFKGLTCNRKKNIGVIMNLQHNINNKLNSRVIVAF